MKSRNIQLIGNGIMVRGYLGGVKQPSFIFTVLVNDRLDQCYDDVTRVIKSFLRATAADHAFAPPTESNEPLKFINLYFKCIEALLSANSHPVLEPARILDMKRRPNGSSMFRVQFPCLDFDAAFSAITQSTKFLDTALEEPGKVESLSDSIAEVKKSLHINLRQGNLNGFNAMHFLKTAHDLDIPWFRLSGDTFQLGYGCNARLLNSSFTDRTPWIANSITKNKNAAARVLRMAGLPVMDQIPVSSGEKSLEAARKLGFPVVVKPADLDGGRGVTALLTEPEDVIEAYAVAAKLAQHVVVEKHFTGKDYRIQVVDGAVHGIVERAPGGVTGDGRSTINELIACQNQEREQAKDDRRFLHPIQKDRECLRMLRLQGLTSDSVPSKGKFVRLRGAANVASGGVPSLVDVTIAHADNLALAVRAARVMRLDVAGVDLIIPEIATSWQETGAAICEVNAQPQMFTTFHQPMLKAILGRDLGNIPVFLVLEEQDGSDLGRNLYEALRKKRPNAGFVARSGVSLAGSRLGPRPDDLFAAVRGLLVDPQLDSVVLSLPAEIPENSGWPVWACDTLVLDAGDGQMQPDKQYAIPKLLTEIQQTLRPQAAYLSENASDWAKRLHLLNDASIASVSFANLRQDAFAQVRFFEAVVEETLECFGTRAETG